MKKEFPISNFQCQISNKKTNFLGIENLILEIRNSCPRQAGFTTTSLLRFSLHDRRLHSRGFTLIELILVISIMLLLGTLGTAFAARFLTQNAVSNATDQLIGDLRQAQINAMIGKQNSNWGVNFGSNMITLYKGTSFATRTTVFDATFSVNTNISITGFSDDNFARVTGIPGFTTPQTITISGSGETKIITINSQGVATR